MSNNDAIRWLQRLEHFEAALAKLTDACKRENYSELELAGVIQFFVFSQELAWNTLKDLLYVEGIDAKTPRAVWREAHNAGFVEDIDTALGTIAFRNELSHRYSEAMARRAPVVVCSTADGATCSESDDWSTGYLVFVDTDDDNAADPTNPDEEIIQRETEKRSVDIAFANVGTGERVRFAGDGIALGFEGTFTFCDERAVDNAAKAKALILNPVGSLRAATDTDSPEDLIVNDADGTNVTCN